MKKKEFLNLPESKQINLALDKAGYIQNDGNSVFGRISCAEDLRECFSDYVDTGTWSNIDAADVGEISIRDMAYNLYSLGRWS